MTVKMPEPTICYGRKEDVRELSKLKEAILNAAGIVTGDYSPVDFIERLEGISLDGITGKTERSTVECQINAMAILARECESVLVRDFDPDENYARHLEDYITTNVQR